MLFLHLSLPTMFIAHDMQNIFCLLQKELVKRLHLLLTVKESAENIPKNLEARRRLEFFTNSLFMDMPPAKPVYEMLPFRCFLTKPCKFGVFNNNFWNRNRPSVSIFPFSLLSSFLFSSGYSVFTPYYSETVLYSPVELKQENEDGISILFYLQKIFPGNTSVFFAAFIIILPKKCATWLNFFWSPFSGNLHCNASVYLF